MSFHHVAIATRDLDATHRFYTEVMGFELVKVVTGETMEGGWAKHVFYDTGEGGLIAFWEIHDGNDEQLTGFNPAISTGLGLPAWTNHIAFDAPTLDRLAEMRDRWVDHGENVVEIDHGWCTSIYINDPNGIMVEFCTTTAAFTDADRAVAAAALVTKKPELEEPPTVTFHKPAIEPSPA